MENIQSLAIRIEESYEEGKPLYVKDNRRTAPTKESVFKIISEADFIGMEESEVQEILREQHIVITDMRHKETGFEEALLEIAPLTWLTGIQGEHTSLFT